MVFLNRLDKDDQDLYDNIERIYKKMKKNETMIDLVYDED